MAKERIRRAISFFFLLAALLATALLIALPRPPEAAKRLNVVIISIDSLRADHMGLYGYARDTTPNLDRFAAGAAVFDRYFSTSALTPVSEASVQTGAYPLRTGVINFASSFSPGVTTIAEILHANGWRTAAFGSSPEFNAATLRPGFSKGFDAYSMYAPAAPEAAVLDSSFVRSGLSNAWRTALFGSAVRIGSQPPSARRTAVPVTSAADWIGDVPSDAPFFLWLAVGSVHWPYGQYAPARFSDPSYDGFLDAARYAKDPASHGVSVFTGLYGTVYGGKRYGPDGEVLSTDLTRDFAHLADSYDDGVYDTDRQLAPLLRLLSSPEFRTNTVVIIESEHGEDLGDHGYIAHYDVLGTQTHVPLIIRAPGVPAARIGSLASGVDVAPTLYSLLGLAAPEGDGVSQYQAMRGADREPPRTRVFLTRTPLWERLLADQIPWLAPFADLDNREHLYDTAVRTDEWLLIHRRTRDALRTYSWYGHLSGAPVSIPEYELYRASSDPLELHDVYAANASAVAPLRAELAAWEREMRAAAPGPQIEKEVQPYF